MRATYGRNLGAKFIADRLSIDNYIPMRQVVSQRKGVKIRKQVPLVKDLIFLRATKEEITDIKRQVTYLQYITRPVNKKNEPIIVPEEQMRNFIDFTLKNDEELIYLNPNEIDLKAGTRIKIHGGEFDGYEGWFVKIAGKRNRRIVVMIDSIIAVAAQVNPDLVEVIKD